MPYGPVPGGNMATLNISTTTVIAVTPTGGPRRVIFTLSVTTAGAAGALYDYASTSGYSNANLIAVVPATVGIYELNWPCTNGILYVPGAAQVASFSYD